VQAVPVEQHASFSLPHSQTPAAHVPEYPVVAIVQVDPAATQRLDEQQAPVSLQVFPAQQGFPVTPQGRQTPALVSHTFPAPVHWLPGQQGSPAPPQWRHW
jgi:hypothetical protein